MPPSTTTEEPRAPDTEVTEVAGQAPASEDLLALAQQLRAQGEAFAMVTVVRAVAPTSTKAGAQALVRADGTLHGWIGGGCTRQVVADAALEALREGAPRLLHLGNDELPVPDDVESHRMRCASNGEIELFVHPYVAAPLLVVLGATPAAACARTFAAQIGFRVASRCEGVTPQLALVATQGDGDEAALGEALASTAGRVLLIASARKAKALREAMLAQGIGAQRLGALEAPAGPDIGARTPAQIALAAVAGALSFWQRGTGARAPALAAAAPAAPAQVARREAQRVADPVCGMLVDTAQARHTIEHEGARYYFCCEGCRRAFEREPARYRARRAESHRRVPTGANS